MARRVERCFSIAALRKLAKRNMPVPMFHYIDRAAGDEWTLRRQTLAFDAVEFMLRTRVDGVGGRLEVIRDGLGAGGEAGVGQASKTPNTELARGMALLGTPTVRDVGASFIRKVGASWG